MLRLGLCCIFQDVPIRFRHTTAAYVRRLAPEARPPFLEALVAANTAALVDAIRWCAAHDVGAFRVLNDLVPLVTHPEVGFRVDALPPALLDGLRAAGALARAHDVRLSFHPDQFVVLSSVEERVVRSGLAELEHLGHQRELLGAAQITVHGGSAAGGKEAAAERLVAGIERLSPRARRHLALENDDRVWTVADLAPVLVATGVPLVYDVHHHRCNPDGLSVAEATDLAVRTWAGREPWLHVSSPIEGWAGPKPMRHADTIDRADVPDLWKGRTFTLDVEAKAKETAVLALRDALRAEGWPLRRARAPA
ncbi:MAG: UV DNA damage repair endonuclease UvsE [Myxococcota bacterium]